MKILSATGMVAVALTLVAAAPAYAADRTVLLAIPSMDCELCGPTVRTSLQRLHGVRVLAVDTKSRTVSVQVSNDKVTNRDVVAATTNAGYPSSVIPDERGKSTK